ISPEKQWEKAVSVRGWLKAAMQGGLAIAAIALSTAPAPSAAAALDETWWAKDPAAISKPVYEDIARSATYVKMRDGVMIAVDVGLRKGLSEGARLPTIIEQPRYYRSAPVKTDPSGSCHTADAAALTMFVRHGYAYVIVDVRGTGASFGTRTVEY